MTFEALAPAKLNLTLEITGRRADGYHDIVSVMQTLDLCDRVRVSDAPVFDLAVEGEALRGVPRDGPRNLAFAAAQALAEAAGDVSRGAHIELEKRIPAGMGLGGGSADAGAVLRALNRLWRLGFSVERLCEVGARIGSDVPFCVVAGSALVTGAGERVEPLPDGLSMDLTLLLPSVELEDKTRRMYSLVRADDYSDGRQSRELAESLRGSLPVAASGLVNAFDRHVASAAVSAGGAMALCRDAGLTVLTCGSGPGFYTPAPLQGLPPELLDELTRDWGVRAIACRTLGRAEATSVREV